MNHSYLRSLRWVPQSQPQPTGVAKSSFGSRLLAAFLLLFSLSFSGFAQTFSEDMSDPGAAGISRELVTDYATRGGFTFDAAGTETGPFTYSGNARTATSANSVGYTGASGGVSIFYGPALNGTETLPQSFNVSNITVPAGGGRVQLTFGLYTYQGAAPSAGDFVVQYTNAGITSSVTYTRTSNVTATGNNFAWNLYTTTTIDADAGPLALSFIRTSRATAITNNNKQFRLDDVTVRTPTPTLTVAINNQIFPNTPVNQQSVPRTLTVAGADLVSNATITAPSGFLLRLAGTTDAYAQTATVAPGSNGNTSAQFDVVFAPTLASSPGPYPQNTTGDITVASTGATTVTVSVLGAATAPQPVLTADPTSLAFGSQIVGTSSAIQSFQLTGRDLTGNVTVSAPSGYEIRVGSAAFSPNPIVLSPASGVINSQVDVRFVPGTTGNITGNIVATGNGSSSATVVVSGSGAPAPVTPTINATPTALDFQTVTNSGSAQVQTFTVSATNLSGPLTLTPSNVNIQIRNATAGGSFSNSSLDIQPNASGNITNQLIEVTLVPVVGQGAFTGSVGLASTGATPVTVSVVASNPSGGISDISLTNPILREFSTSPGVASGIQSYNVSADNLLQDLTIVAPQFFQISLTPDFTSLGTTTGNTLVLTRAPSSGDITETTIYVRYFPPAAQTNRGQVVSNSSAPARTQFVSVNGSSEPELNIRGTFVPVVNQVKGTQSAIQQLSIVGARLNSPVTVRVPQDPEPPTTASPLNPNRTPQFQISRTADFSDLGTVSNPNGIQLTLAPDANDSLARVPLYARYAPTRVGSALADLLFRTPDLLNVEFVRVPNARLEGKAIDVEPIRQTSATVVRSGDSRSVTINFFQENGSPLPGNSEGAGFGENRLIIASLNSTLTVGSFPQDGTAYGPGNSVYGAGSNINGNFVVFASTGTTAVITGLTPGVQYYFYGFEYNNDGTLGAENYKTPNLPISVQQPLPVELVSFTAQLRGSQVNLNWVTASEKNNRGFEVQRSQDARDFSTVLFKEGNGTTSARSTYATIDARPLPGLNYYRLKQIDNDGQFAYSPVVIVKNAGLTEAILFPNPTSGKLTVALPQATTAEALRVRIMDLTGRVMLETKLPVTGELDLGGLPNGTYMVTVGAGQQQVIRKVVKN